MLYFSIQNVHPLLRGGLRTDGNGLGSCAGPARILLGSCSDRLRVGNGVSAVFRKFLPDVGRSFCVAGAR